MKIKLMLLSLATLYFSQTIAMYDIDQAIGTLDVEWVEAILNENECTAEQKGECLVTIKRLVHESQRATKALLDSQRDTLRFLFGLGLTGMSGIPISAALFSFLFGHNQRLTKSKIITLGIGSLAAGFGIYNVIKGWNLQSAYSRLSKARRIQELIQNIVPVNAPIK